MLPLIALLLIAVPIVEIAVLIQVGGLIGVWNTVALVILTSFAGTVLLRVQGLATLARVQESLARNAFPGDALFDGACVLVAGTLLLVPGFVSDTLGLLLFLPPVRKLLRRLLLRQLRQRGGTRIWIDGEEIGPGAGGPGPGGPTIDGEYREVDPRREDAPPRGRIGRDARDGDGSGPSRWGRR